MTMPKKLLAALLAAALSARPAAAQTTSYEVNLLDRADDRFKVVVQLTGLGPADSIFQFAATRGVRFGMVRDKSPSLYEAAEARPIAFLIQTGARAAITKPIHIIAMSMVELMTLSP